MRAREKVVGVVAVLAAVTAMAVDHLFGTQDDSETERFAEPGVFFGAAAAALIATVLLFRFVVLRAADEPDRAATKAIVCSLLAVLALPLLFLAAPFPLAGAGVALGLIGREGRHRRRATTGAILGLAVMLLGVGAYLVALLS